MSVIRRLKQFPWFVFFFLFSTFVLCFLLGRFVEPIPKQQFYPVFWLEFVLGFFPQLYQRKSGRILTVLFLLVLPRASYWSGLAYEGGFHLLGLWAGVLSGIWLREFLLILSDRANRELPKQSDHWFTSWLIRNPPSKPDGSFFVSPFFGFLVFLWVLFPLLVLQYQGLNPILGLGLQDSLYFRDLSSRQGMGIGWSFLTHLVCAVLYILSEERTLPTPSKDSLSEQTRFGFWLGISISFFVAILQTGWDLSFFSQRTGETLVTGRSSGLFIDSGSASWIFPTAFALFLVTRMKEYPKTKEKFPIFVLGFITFLMFYLGKTQGKGYWVILLLSLLYLSLYYGLKIFLPNLRYPKLVFFSTLLFSSILAFFTLKLLSLLSSSHSLVQLSLRITNAIPNLFSNPKLALLALDTVRFELLGLAWDGFLASPWFGQGIGSFPVFLSGDYASKLTYPMVDYPPNFFLWLLHDLGILGFFVFLGFLFWNLWERNLWKQASLLLLPFCFGVQIQHMDSAFVFVYILSWGGKGEGYSTSYQKVRFFPWFKPLAIVLLFGVCLNYLLFCILSLDLKAYGADFRKQELGKFQNGASFFPRPNAPVYTFLGSHFEWKLLELPNRRRTNFILETKTGKDYVEFQFLDRDKEWLSSQRIQPVNGVYVVDLEIPRGSVYLRLHANEKLGFDLPKESFDVNHQFRE